MRNFLVLREFLKDKEENFLNPELKIYKIIELLNINKKNYYKAQILTRSTNDEKLTIFLIFLFNYLDKGHLRANINLLAIDIRNILTYAKENIEKNLKEKNKSIVILQELEIFKSLNKINEIILLLKEKNILIKLNKSLKITTPLALENEIYIYTQKNYREEEKLIKQINKRLQNYQTKISTNKIKSILSKINKKNLSAGQIISIQKALKSNFFLLSGGPGTGKTTVINYILKAIDNLQEQKRVAIVAPTGKASLRLKTSINYSFENLEIECNTIQKLLGIKFINKKSLYDENKQLEFDIIIIDEASMIDAYTFLKLLQTTPITTKLIIIGDKNQLPSINEGNVYSSLLEIKTINYDIVEILRENFRNNKEISLLAEAIYKEDDVLISKCIRNSKNIFWKPIDKINLENEMLNYVNNLYKKTDNFDLKLLDDKKIEEILASISESIILSSKNFGEFGIIKINNMIKSHLNKIYGAFIGQIIMITQNDYKNKLFNGERGIIFTENSNLYALFQKEHEKYKKINFNLLTNYEMSFATTIHKSQGSEYKHVNVILEDDPFMTKELIYTSITRTKESLTIISKENTIQKLSKISASRDSKILDYIKSLKKIDN